MADNAVDEFDGDVFIYRGGWAPLHITHARIDESVNEIEDDEAFARCEHLVQVDTHDGIRRVGRWAFLLCKSLRRINLKSAVEISCVAFDRCENLESVEFGDRLEKIGGSAFSGCTSLKHVKLPSIRIIAVSAFYRCKRLTEVELSERLERIDAQAFANCERLQRIAIPLKRDLIPINQCLQKCNQFDDCEQLKTVDLVGGIHKTVASLHMDSWRTDMISEINRINQVLPNTPADEKSNEVRQWMESVLDKMDHYKAEHQRYVKEGTTLLELALWKAKLGEKVEYAEERKPKQVKVDAESYRREKRITCGADVVIKNVLPFLKLE